ncbi:MAG: amidohydrolase [Thermomicrobiales bacterium]
MKSSQDAATPESASAGSSSLEDVGTITVYPARTIVTMNDGQPTADVVAVADGRILSVGTMESIQPWLDVFPHEIDDTFADMVLMPGFIDPHLHLIIGGTYMSAPYIGHYPMPKPGGGYTQPVKDKAEAIVRMRAASDVLSDPDEELFVYGWDEPFQGELTRADLDQISATRPVAVMGYSWHMLYANSAMLAKRGVTRDTEIYGVRKDADGEPTGVFQETLAGSIIVGPMAPGWFAPEKAAAAIRYSAGVAQGTGVTTTSDMAFGLVDLDTEDTITRDLIQDPTFPVRIQAVYDGATAIRNHGDDPAGFTAALRERNDDRLFYDHVKFFVDGGFLDMAGQTGWPGPIGGQEMLWNTPNGVPPQDMWKSMLPFWKAGIDIHVHVVSDLGLDAVIDTLARLQLEHPRFDHRFTLEHMGIAHPHQLRRLASLGGLISNNIYYVYYRAERYARVGYGPDRSYHMSPLGDVARAGIPFAVHSDMTIGPCIPLEAVWIAVNRVGQNGTVIMPEQRVSLDLALKAVTINAAYILRLDHFTGSIEVGKWADFAVLKESPFEVEPMAIKDIPVWGTVVGGVKFPASGA